MQLDYLFTAEYEDGSIFVQPLDNKSKNHDDNAEHNPSAYSDIDQDKLVRFTLTGKGHVYSVDLKTGFFTIDDVQFTAADQNFVPCNPLRLIYFREIRKTFNVEMDEIDHYVNRYFIGWQTNDEEGKNIQHTIGVV